MAVSLRQLLIGSLAFFVVFLAFFNWIDASVNDVNSPYYGTQLDGTYVNLTSSARGVNSNINNLTNTMSSLVENSNNPSTLGLFQLPGQIFSAIMIPFKIAGQIILFINLTAAELLGVSPLFSGFLITALLITIMLIVISIIGRTQL